MLVFYVGDISILCVKYVSPFFLFPHLVYLYVNLLLGHFYTLCSIFMEGRVLCVIYRLEWYPMKFNSKLQDSIFPYIYIYQGFQVQI
jgi:hypothetical protein